MIIDSRADIGAAFAQNPASPCPIGILSQLRLLRVRHYGFDGLLHEGQIVVNAALLDDVDDVFHVIESLRFPLTSVIPVSDARFRWSDDASMAADNSSGFNYRTIAGSPNLSQHAYGRAIDLNPRRNPYTKGDVVLPPGAVYDPTKPGTLRADDLIVRFLEERGWTWGGRWTNRTDYQHFEKAASA